MKLFPATFALSLLLAVTIDVLAQAEQSRSRIAVLDCGDTNTGKLASAKISDTLALEPELSLVDRDLAHVAARGVGYTGSLNLTLQDARDLGAAIGCDFYIIGDAQTVRRSPSTGPIYYESYASLFLVSARTGRLITWERPSLPGATSEAAEKRLLAALCTNEMRNHYLIAIKKALVNERRAREFAVGRDMPVIEEVPEETSQDAKGLRLPRPYRRLRPPYPESAALAGAEGTVDVLVELDTEGEVSRVEIARWAGFGLDEATVNTVRQLHFFPAMRDGKPIPMRVLLRYNFGQPSSK